MRRPSRVPRCRPEINVTPLVDVTLVLLIVFLVVTPYLQRGVEVTLPVARHATPPEDPEREALVVTLRRDGSLWLGTERMSRGTLAARVRAILAREPGREILLKGDEGLAYGEIRALLVLLRGAGAPGVAMAAETQERG